MLRREFVSGLLTGGMVAASTVLLPGCGYRQKETPLISVARDSYTHDFSLRVFSSKEVKQTLLPLPARGHAMELSPLGIHAVCFGRRPSRELYVVNLATQLLEKVVDADPGRHFFGHGVFSRDGTRLFTTENAYADTPSLGVRGVIGVYRTSDWHRIQEFEAGGIGCHDIKMHPDGRTLIVANGGIMTHPSQPRKKLNLDTMVSSLCYVDSETGRLLERQTFGHHQLSIRHIDVTADGRVIFGMQHQGERSDIHPVVAEHRRGESVRAMDATEHDWLQFSQYVASVACLSGENIAVTTSPRGNQVVFWDLFTRKSLATFSVQDVSGVAVTGPKDVAVSNGLGEIITYQVNQMRVEEVHRVRYPGTGWDNHLVTAV